MNKKRIFISHSTEEKEIALNLKETIKKDNSSAEVFCSSDYESLPKGKSPAGEIFNALEQAECLLTLVSSESVKNQWVNFETGFFYAHRKKFHVICIGNFAKGSITGPLGILQATALNDPSDMRQLFAEIGLAGVDDIMFRQLVEAGNRYPSPRIRVQPYLLNINDKPSLALLIQNGGDGPKEFTKAILKAPLSIIQENWAASDTPPTLRWERNRHMAGTLISTEAAVPAGYPVVPRPDRIIPAFGALDTQEYYLRMPLKNLESIHDGQIEYEVVVDGKTFSGKEALKNLPFKDHPASLRPGTMIKYVSKLDQLPPSLFGAVSWKFRSKVSDEDIALDEFGVEHRLKDPAGDMVAVYKQK